MGYKRYGSRENIPNFDEEEYEAVSSQLSDRQTSKHIYFGIKKPKTDPDDKKSWRELAENDFNIQIKSDTDGCSATITKNDNDTTNKTGIITYRLSKNTTGSSRVITFNYKGTTLFTITQDGNLEESTNVYIIYFICSYNLNGSYFSSDQGYSHGDISQYQGGSWNSKSYNVLWYFTDNNQSSFNINETRIKNIIDNNILTYNSGRNLLNTEPYKNFIIQKGPDEYMHESIYTTGEKIKLTDDIYIYENTISGNSKISVSPINFSKITESYHIGVYTYNKNNDVVHTKKKYTIYMFGKVEGGHFANNQKCYLFTPNESRVTTNVEYTQISVMGDANNVNYGTYFILDNSGQLTSDIFNHVTIYELQKYYNLTKISGDIYLTNECYVNNITDTNIVNVFGSTRKGTLRNTQNNTYVKVAWLYNKSSDNTYYTNAKESWGTDCIINVTKPAGIFTIEV